MTTAIKCPDFLTHVKGLKEWWVYTIETDNPSCGKLTTTQPGGIPYRLDCNGKIKGVDIGTGTVLGTMKLICENGTKTPVAGKGWGYGTPTNNETRMCPPNEYLIGFKGNKKFGAPRAQGIENFDIVCQKEPTANITLNSSNNVQPNSEDAAVAANIMNNSVDSGPSTTVIVIIIIIIIVVAIIGSVAFAKKFVL